MSSYGAFGYGHCAWIGRRNRQHVVRFPPDARGAVLLVVLLLVRMGKAQARQHALEMHEPAEIIREDERLACWFRCGTGKQNAVRPIDRLGSYREWVSAARPQKHSAITALFNLFINS